MTTKLPVLHEAAMELQLGVSSPFNPQSAAHIHVGLLAGLQMMRRHPEWAQAVLAQELGGDLEEHGAEIDDLVAHLPIEVRS